jgi:hypothetical protein
MSFGNTSHSTPASADALVWKDLRKERGGLRVQQIMCECCGFWVNLRTTGNDGVANVQVRFENRCPIMIFSQVCDLYPSYFYGRPCNMTASLNHIVWVDVMSFSIHPYRVN